MTEVDPSRQPSGNTRVVDEPGLVLQRLENLALIVQQVEQLHQGGRFHGRIGQEAIREDAHGTLLLDPPPETVTFGSDAEEVEVYPAELDQAVPLSLPTDLAEAGRILKQRGIALNPARLDLYQLGAYLCRSVTGESIPSYLCSPKTLSRVPHPLRKLIDGAIGVSPQTTFAAANDLALAIDEATASLRGEGEEHLAALDPAEAPSSVLEAESVADTTIAHRKASRAKHDDLPFERLGHYEIQDRIGQGGMGDVYLGYEAELDRHVAIKVLPREFARESDFVRRFRQEAAAVARLSHPNTVQIYFIGEDNGHLFFAMQLVEGASLAHRLAECGPLSVAESLQILRDVLSGLAAAHAQGMVHRDIKPGNVLLERSGRALLGDFGLVKSQKELTSRTATGVIMGTVDYIAPEQGRGQAVDGRSDLYATGVMTYQMLSGRLPFEADSPTAMIFLHVYEQPAPLSQVAPEVSPVLQAIVVQMMAKSPADRYQTAEEVLTDLDAFLAGDPLPSGADVIDLDAESSSLKGASRPVIASRLASSAAPPTTIVTAPVWTDEPFAESPPEPPARRWWSAWAARFHSQLQRHAPQQLVDQIHNTQQQFDGAVRSYERRRDKLRDLISQAEECLGELQSQQRDWQEAINDAENRLTRAADEQEHQEIVDEAVRAQATVRTLDEQISEQEDHLANMRLQGDQLESRVQQLTQQRDLLAARLKTAQAKARIVGGTLSSERKQHRRRRVLMVAGAAGILVLGLFVLLSFRRPDATTHVSTAGIGPVTAATGGETHYPARVDDERAGPLLLIPAGTYLMGRSAEEPGVQSHEQPQRAVAVGPFYLGETEVTVAQFRRFVAETGYQTTAETDGVGGWGYSEATREIEQPPGKYSWREVGYDQTPEHPVSNVSWNDAAAYCDWLTKKDGAYAYRLPTEEEWEYACRGGTTSVFHFGNTATDVAMYENVADESLQRMLKPGTMMQSAQPTGAWSDGYAFAAPVRQFQANAFGLYDMAGNVSEWCQDWYGSDTYSTGVAPTSGDKKAFRGGNWGYRPSASAAGSRHSFPREAHWANLGFRVARDVQPRRGQIATKTPLQNFKRPPRRGVLNEDRPLAPSLQFVGHTDDVRAVACSPDGSILATGGEDGTVRLWNAATGAQTAVFENDLDEHSNRIGFSQLAFSSDGSLLACGNTGYYRRNRRYLQNDASASVRVVDVAARRVIRKLDTGPVKLTSMAFVPDAPELWLSDDAGEVSRWNAQTGERINQIALTQRFIGQTAFGSGATSLAHLTPQQFVLWDVAPQSRRKEWKNPIWTPDRAEQWDGAAESASQGIVSGWTDLSLAYSPDGRWIATGSKESTVHLWDAESGEQVADLGAIVDRVDALAFDPRSRYLAVASGGVNIRSENFIHVWEFQHNRLLVTRPTHEVEALTFHPTESTLISVGETPQVQKWDVKFPVRYLARPIKHTPNGDGRNIYQYSMSTKGDVLLADTSDEVRFLEREHDEFRRLEQVDKGVTRISLSGDGKRAVGASRNGALGSWDVQSKRQLRRIHLQLNVEDEKSESIRYHNVYALAFLPDNRRVVVGTNQTLFLWDTKTGNLTYPFQDEPYEPERAMAVSPDGRFVAVGGTNNGTKIGVIRLWDVESGRYLRRMVSDDEEVNSLAFSQDGSYLVSGGEGAIHLWNVETAEEVRRIPVIESAEEIRRIRVTSSANVFDGNVETKVRGVAISPDGRWIAATRLVGPAIWELATGEEVFVYRHVRAYPNHVSFSADGQELICGGGDGVYVWPVKF